MAVASVPTIALSDGYEIPQLGLGTLKAEVNVAEEAVRTAIGVGYRHIDCAPLYGNEKEIGCAIRSKIAEGAVKREDLFLTSKVWCTHHSKDTVRKSLNKTLKDLQTDYLDLYLMHWPMGFKDGSNDPFPKDENEEVIFSDVDYLETWKVVIIKLVKKSCLQNLLIKSLIIKLACIDL